MREINLLDQEINCYDDIQYMEDSDSLSFAWETWFDVDKYFGTNTRDDDSIWINFYTRWFENGDVLADFAIVGEEDIICKWELTDEEKEFLTKKMEEYVILLGQENSLLECLNNERKYYQEHNTWRRTS